MFSYQLSRPHCIRIPALCIHRTKADEIDKAYFIIFPQRVGRPLIANATTLCEALAPRFKGLNRTTDLLQVGKVVTGKHL
jgi:hypothetical protein